MASLGIPVAKMSERGLGSTGGTIDPKELLELTLTIGSYMLICAQIANNREEVETLLKENIQNGKAIKKLKEFIKAQGGNIEYIEDTSKFPEAKYIIPVKSDIEGYITKIRAEAFGLIVMELGAGRVTKDSKIDLSVCIILLKKRGDKVNKVI